MENDLAGKSILVCVCGGIAAYKVCEVVSRLAQRGASVSVAMTAEARRFVGVTTFEALSGKPVATSLWEDGQRSVPHIALAQGADLVLIAPCTANMLGKFANGIADDLISTLLLAVEPKKVLAAPAMNHMMWAHPATQRNAKQLQQDGVSFIGPAEGWQACRAVGPGRMSEPGEILAAVEQRLAGK